MLHTILEERKVAELGSALYGAGSPCKRATCLVGQPSKMINVMSKKVSDCMKPSCLHSLFLASSASVLAYVHKILIHVNHSLQKR